MIRTLLIGAAALAFACGGGSHPSDTRDRTAASAAPGGSAQAGNANAAPQPGGDQGGATQVNQTVTLVGCLVGPNQPIEPTATAGARARAPETTASSGAGATSDRFLLVDAIVPGADVGGVGANGAGGSGGPLVTGKATFELDGIPVDARAGVNKQVKVVGRLDARPVTVDGAAATSGSGSSGAAGTRGAMGASSGITGSGVGSGSAGGAGSGAAAASPPPNVPSGSSDAAGAHGTGQKSVAGHGTMGSAARSDIRNQRLVVESVQVIAENCRQR